VVEARTDEELLAAHAQGQSAGFDELVRRYSPELFGFLLRFIGNAALAEDLLQEVFVQVHSAAAGFDPERRFKPWVYTIAANKARDALRSRARRVERSLDAGDDGDERSGAAQQIPATDNSAAEELEASEQTAAVRATIARMPEHLREILVLGYYQQLPYAEIATILEIPVGTVKSRLHSAVNHFARLWRAAEEARTGEAADP
jgi:RNA polymerase sigma-70 factor (ECF subfamily)